MDKKEQRIVDMHAERAAAFKKVVLDPLVRKLPPDSRGLTLICVARNEGWRLADFMDHYRRLGVRRFVFVDNASTDDSREFLSAQPDVDLWSAPEKYDPLRRISWIHRLMAEYGYNAWYLSVDADEFIVYDGCWEHNLDSLVALAEHDGNTRLRGIFLDMYGQEPLVGGSVPTGAPDMRADCPYFDADGYVIDICATYVLAEGGPRARMFRTLAPDTPVPSMTKYPLAYIRPGDFFITSHLMAPIWENFLSECVLGILHYKFSRLDRAKIEDAVKNGQYWNNSQEYRHCAQWLENNPGASLMCGWSREYKSPEDLVKAGLIMAIDWANPSRTPTVYQGGLMDACFNKFRFKVTRKMKKEKDFWAGLRLPMGF